MHDWSDQSVDWENINKAAEYIYYGLKKWLVPVRDYKEKFGTVRVYTGLGWNSIHDLTHTGHMYCRYKKDGLLWRLNYSRFMSRVVFRLLNKIVVPIHVMRYRYLYKQAVRRWPHLRQEILCAADYDELLTDI